MISLFVFGPAFGLPDSSPFGMKVRFQLAMAGLDYEVRFDGYPKAPKGKLPFIDDDGEIVADSTMIRAHLETRHAVDLEKGLNAQERAQAWALERLLEDHLYWLIAHERWLNEENFKRGPAHFFDGLPEGQADAMRQQTLEGMRSSLWAQGLGRHSLEERMQLAKRDFDTMSAMLGEKQYLFGGQVTAVDATLAAMTLSAACPLFETPLRDLAESYPALISHGSRVLAAYGPKTAPVS